MAKRKKCQLKLGKETYGDRDIYEAFAEALSSYFVVIPKQEEQSLSKKSS
jgi:hypothetical protein